MSTLGTLGWREENAREAYPLAYQQDMPKFIVDATWVQFDGYVPVLHAVSATGSEVTLEIQTREGLLTETVSLVSISGLFTTVSWVDEYDRSLGRTVLSAEGLASVIAKYAGSRVVCNYPFAACTVVSVNHEAGVYSIENRYGNVHVSTVNADSPEFRQAIFIQASAPQTWTWNASSMPGDFTEVTALKTINGVGPQNFGIWIETNDIIRATPGEASLTLDMVNPLSNDKVAPVQHFQS